jgi:hypothetical protein
MYQSSPEALILRACGKSETRTHSRVNREDHAKSVCRSGIMPEIHFARRQTGFTLVETAITLTIIGLIIGGVIKGQDLITNARLKKMEKDSTGISIVIHAYQDRYGSFPGDDIKAASRFSVYSDDAANDINGNGDGSIDGNWIGAANSETANLWKHLRAAGFIPGNGDDDRRPKNAYNGDIGVREGSLRIAGRVAVFGLIDGTVARILESRLDDGNPSFGSVQSDLSENLMDGNVASSAGTSYSESTRYFMSLKI